MTNPKTATSTAPIPTSKSKSAKTASASSKRESADASSVQRDNDGNTGLVSTDDEKPTHQSVDSDAVSLQERIKNVPQKTCAGTKQFGHPCTSTELLFGGFCKFHSSLLPQCKGTAVSTGEKCKIRLDLKDGYCIDHHPKTLKCMGKTLTGARCSVGRDLIDGFCKQHHPSSARCQAMCVDTDTQCKVRGDLDEDGLCRHHSGNAPTCRGWARSKGRPCQRKYGLNPQGYCEWHQ